MQINSKFYLFQFFEFVGALNNNVHFRSFKNERHNGMVISGAEHPKI